MGWIGTPFLTGCKLLSRGFSITTITCYGSSKGVELVFNVWILMTINGPTVLYEFALTLSLCLVHIF